MHTNRHEFLNGGYELFGQVQIENEESAGACGPRGQTVVREWEGIGGLAGGYRTGELR